MFETASTPTFSVQENPTRHSAISGCRFIFGGDMSKREWLILFVSLTVIALFMYGFDRALCSWF